MKHGMIIAVACLVSAGAVLAQAPESVTVTGTKEQQAITRFVEASVTPTRMTGKTARWEGPICIGLQGIKPEDAAYMVGRVKKNAADAGVRVNAKSDCDPNIEIIFTDQAQAVMDQVKETQPDLLGYADTPAERDQLAVVRRPVQAWYRTATQDLRGHTVVDGDRSTDAPGRGVTAMVPCANTAGNRQLQVRNGVQVFAAVPGSMCRRDFDYIKANTAGFALQDGLRSQFDHVAIIVDTDKVATLKSDAVSDYVSMVALAQLSSLDTCQGLSSITNLLVAGCANVPETITVNDRAYLQGVYKSDPTLAPVAQKGQIASQMGKTLGAR